MKRKMLTRQSSRLFDNTVVLTFLEIMLNLSDIINLERTCQGLYQYVHQRRPLVLMKLKVHPCYMAHIHPIFLNDLGVMKVAIQGAPGNIRHVSANLRDNEELVLSAVNKNGDLLAYASTSLRRNRDVVMAALSSVVPLTMFKFVCKSLCACPLVMYDALHVNGRFLQFASDEIRSSVDFAFLAVSQTPFAAEFALGEVNMNKDFGIFSVGACGANLKYLDEKLKEDVDVAIAAVSHRPETYFLLPEITQNNKQVLLETISRASGEVVKKIVIKLASGRYIWLADREVVWGIVSKSGSYLEWVSTEMKENAEVALAAAVSSQEAVRFIGTALMSSPEFVRCLLRARPLAFSFTGPAIRDDMKLASLALFLHSRNILHVSHRLRSDAVFMRTVLRYNGSLFMKHAGQKIKKDIMMVEHAYRHDTSSIRYCHQSLFNDFKFVQDALRYDGMMLAFMPDFIKRDEQMVLVAASSDRRSVGFMCESLKHSVGLAKKLIEIDLDLAKHFDPTVAFELIFAGDPYAN